MPDKNKTILFSAAGILGILLIILAILYLPGRNYRKIIPEIADPSSITDAVAEQISEALKKAKRNPSVQNLGILGMVYHSSANYSEAAGCYELAIERDTTQWIWYYYLGYLYTEMSESKSVLENFNRVIGNNPDAYHAWYYCGEEYMNLGEYEKSEEYLERIRTVGRPGMAVKMAGRKDHFSLDTYARFQLANIYNNTGRTELAEKTLLEVIYSDRRFGPAYRLLGNIYRMKGDMVLGDQYVATANDMNAFSPPVDTLVDQLALMSRSELYLLKKIDEAVASIHSDWAVKLIEQGLQHMPGSKHLISKAITVYLWLDMEKQAAQFVDQHILQYQDDFNMLNFVGLVFFDKEYYASALKYLQKLQESHPDETEILMNMAICYWHTGQQQQAYDVLGTVLDNHPDNLDRLADVADIMIFEMGEYERSMGLLGILAQFYSSDAKVRKILAWDAERNGEVSKAIRLYESSFSDDPEDITTIKNASRLMIGQKLWDRSITFLGNALEHHPNEPYILERLGTVLILCPDPALSNIQEGMVYAERAFVHNSSSPGISIAAGRSLAMAYAVTGDKQSAGIIMNTVMEIARREQYAREHLKQLQDYANSLQYLNTGT